MSHDTSTAPVVSTDPVKPLSPADLLTTPNHLATVNSLMTDCNNALQSGKDSITFGYQMVGPALKAVIKSFEDAGCGSPRRKSCRSRPPVGRPPDRSS